MKNLFNNKIYIFYSCIITIISFVDIMVYWTMRNSWFFINEEIENSLGKKLPIDWIILILLLIFFIIIAINTSIIFSKNHRNINISVVKNIVIPTVLVIFSTILVNYLFNELNITNDTVTIGFKTMAPYVSIGFLIAFLLFIYPKMMLSQSNIFKYVTLIVMVLVAFYFSQDLGKVKIIAGPFIQYTEDNKMAVIWITNKNSTGYVDYGDNKENLKRAYDTTNGIVNANSKIHKVIIQRSDSKELIYKVGSKKVNYYFEYEVKYGNVVEGDFKTIKSNLNNEDTTFYVLSDVHDNTDIYREFLSKDDYDFLVLNGDLIDGARSEDLIIKNFIKPISKYTNGEKPIYLVRGNHETRGKYQGNLIDYFELPSNRYYYDFNFGPIYSIVLDSGEDAVDDDKKYSGLSNFKDYKEEEMRWLQGLSKTEGYENSLYKIAFVHIPVNDYEYTKDISYLKDYQVSLAKTLSEMKIQATFSGHTHVPDLVEPNEISTYPIFIGGGEIGDEENYMAIKVTTSKEEMKVQYISYVGDITKEYTIKNGD